MTFMNNPIIPLSLKLAISYAAEGYAQALIRGEMQNMLNAHATLHEHCEDAAILIRAAEIEAAHE